MMTVGGMWSFTSCFILKVLFSPFFSFTSCLCSSFNWLLMCFTCALYVNPISAYSCQIVSLPPVFDQFFLSFWISASSLSVCSPVSVCCFMFVLLPASGLNISAFWTLHLCPVFSFAPVSTVTKDIHFYFIVYKTLENMCLSYSTV